MWIVVLVTACLVHCLQKTDLHKILDHCQKLVSCVYMLNQVIKCFECLIAFAKNSLIDHSPQERKSLAKRTSLLPHCQEI